MELAQTTLLMEKWYSRCFLNPEYRKWVPFLFLATCQAIVSQRPRYSVDFLVTSDGTPVPVDLQAL